MYNNIKILLILVYRLKDFRPIFTDFNNINIENGTTN